jgi:hypothetical protein
MSQRLCIRPASTRALAPVLLSLLLCACQGTSFEQPPIAASDCDPALGGHWSSLDDDPEDNGDVQLDVDADCDVLVSERKDGAMRAGEPTRLSVGEDGGARYLWVDATWSARRFESKFEPAPDDVNLMRYTVEGKRLLMHAPDDKAIAHRIVDGDIPGETVKDDRGLDNRITGGPHPEVLALPGFFAAPELRFERTGEAAPISDPIAGPIADPGPVPVQVPAP